MLEPLEQKNFDDLFCLGPQHGRSIFCFSRLLGVSENQEYFSHIFTWRNTTDLDQLSVEIVKAHQKQDLPEKLPIWSFSKEKIITGTEYSLFPVEQLVTETYYNAESSERDISRTFQLKGHYNKKTT